MAGDDPIRREIIKTLGWLDAPPELLDAVPHASKKELTRAATDLGVAPGLAYILDGWADETLDDHEVLAILQAWNRSLAERAMHDVQQGRAPVKPPAHSLSSKE